MGRNRSLDEFLAEADAGRAADEATADESAAPARAELDADAPDAPPMAETFAWSAAGGTCAGCGARVEARWRDGDGLVCGDCKAW